MLRKTIIVLFVLSPLILAACSGSAGDAPPIGPGNQAGGDTAPNQPVQQPASAQTDTTSATTTTYDTALANGSYEDYTLFAPLTSTTTYLIDDAGQVVHRWETSASPGQSSYLLESGNLLYTATVRSDVFQAGGVGGRVEEYTWDGALVWSFEYAGPAYQLHHDVERLPNGNVLMIAWESKTAQEAQAAGRDSALIPAENSLWADHIIEVNPATNQIVWEWHIWDHLVQDVNSGAANYGSVSGQPERIDINYTSGPRVVADWTHVNAVDYNPALDQIMLSVHGFNEIWVIDHSTTTQQAAGSTGGQSGRGGDLLYRWGNPAAHGAAGAQQLFGQHDSKWIEPGLPGAGNILVFNNGDQQTHNYSSVVEIAPPVDGAGNYALSPGAAYGPASPVWEYTSSPPQDFYATNISGASRLANGNTFICDGPAGRLFEVTPDGTIVWEYVVPTTDAGSSAPVFRAERYTSAFAGLVGKTLTPDGTVPAQSGPPNGAGGPGSAGGPGGAGGPPNTAGGPPGG